MGFDLSVFVVASIYLIRSNFIMLAHLADPFIFFQVYYISKATLKVANKQYTTLKNDYEMTLHAHSSIVPCTDCQDIPMVQCDFVPIGDLENRGKDDIIGKAQCFQINTKRVIINYLLLIYTEYIKQPHMKRGEINNFE